MSIWYNLELVPPRLKDADDRRVMAKFVAALSEKFTDIHTYTVSGQLIVENRTDDIGCTQSGRLWYRVNL